MRQRSARQAWATCAAAEACRIDGEYTAETIQGARFSDELPDNLGDMALTAMRQADSEEHAETGERIIDDGREFCEAISSHCIKRAARLYAGMRRLVKARPAYRRAAELGYDGRIAEARMEAHEDWCPAQGAADSTTECGAECLECGAVYQCQNPHCPDCQDEGVAAQCEDSECTHSDHDADTVDESD